MITEFHTPAGTVRPVNGVSLSIGVGETLALVGKSGSGKSVTALSIMRLLPRRVGRIAGGRLGLDGVADNLAALGERQMRGVRGNVIGMIFQEPMSSLNPLMTIGEQVAEPLRLHRGLAHGAAAREAVAALCRVGLPDPDKQARRYPHELSGGMRQRAMIALALACRPRLLIADEPTTALDVTIQAQIVELLRRLQAERGMGMLFITHNLGLVAGLAHRMAVMYAGRIVEYGPVADIFARPRHPYTRGLIACMPRLGTAHELRHRNEKLPAIAGTAPGLLALPPGCGFAPRCQYTTAECNATPPPIEAVAPGHGTRCLHWRTL